jgi:hypothetical protein
MYHGDHVPGSPTPPPRLRDGHLRARGLHRPPDSLGATARFGGGDTQWITAGAGIVHCEMFLIERDRPNPSPSLPDLAQPLAADKMAEPP